MADANSLQPIMDEFLIFFTPAQENITQNHIERYNSIATYHFKYWNIFFNLVPVPVLQLLREVSPFLLVLFFLLIVTSLSFR